MLRSRQEDEGRIRMLWRVTLLGGTLLFLAAPLALQVIAHQRASDVEGPEQVQAGPAADREAETHWHSLLLGNRELFLAGFSDDALLVLSDPDGLLFAASEDADPDTAGDTADAVPQQTFSGLAAIADAWDAAIAPMITNLPGAADVVVELRMQRSEARRHEALLRIVRLNSSAEAEEESVLFEMHAAARMDEDGNIFEERLELLRRPDAVSDGALR